VFLNNDRTGKMTEPSETTSRVHISTIEWDMMDKTKFLPLSMLSSFCVRCTLYPLTLIKTRLQIQKHGGMYKGTQRLFSRKYCIDACKKKILHFLSFKIKLHLIGHSVIYNYLSNKMFYFNLFVSYNLHL